MGNLAQAVGIRDNCSLTVRYKANLTQSNCDLDLSLVGDEWELIRLQHISMRPHVLDQCRKGISGFLDSAQVEAASNEKQHQAQLMISQSSEFLDTGFNVQTYGSAGDTELSLGFPAASS